MKDDITLSRRRVLGGIATIGAAGATAGAGTFAAFSSEHTNDQTISAGTVTLSEPVVVDIGLDNTKPGDTFHYEVQTTYSGSIDGAILSLSAELVEPSSERAEPTSGGTSSVDLSASEFASGVKIDSGSVVYNDSDGNEYTDQIIENPAYETDVTASNQDDIVAFDSETGGDTDEINDDPEDDDPGTDNHDLVEVSAAIEEAGNDADGYLTVSHGDELTITLDGEIDGEAGNDWQADGVTLRLTIRAEQA